MTHDTDVYRGQELVGHIDYVGHGYTLRSVPGQAGFLSTNLTLGPQEIVTSSLHPYFVNLLPEGIRQTLLMDAARSKDDLLEILAKVGWDTIGDVAVLPHGASPGDAKAFLSATDFDGVDFWEKFYEGVGAKPDSSIPGAIEKISTSTVTLGVKQAGASNAILKLSSKRFPRLARNEEFFLKMARACKIPTNKATLVSDQRGNEGLLVERFDRVKRGSETVKLHQEDACQLLNIMPAGKFRVSYRDVVDAAVKVCSAPLPEAMRLLQLYAFSYIIGNGDLHAKNVSVLWDKIIRVTPAYDLLSTLPYPVDQHMALKLNGRDDNFKPQYFVEFGELFGLPEKGVLSMLRHLTDKATPWISKISEIGFDDKTTEKLQREINSRVEKMKPG